MSIKKEFKKFGMKNENFGINTILTDSQYRVRSVKMMAIILTKFGQSISFLLFFHLILTLTCHKEQQTASSVKIVPTILILTCLN